MKDEKIFSEIYEDVIARSKSSDREINNHILKILRKHKIKKVWDNACGSGRQAIFLSNKGYKVLASDINKDFIKRLKNKRKHLNLRIKVRDMENPPNEKFDCIISRFNSICHLNKKGLETALGRWKNSLNKNGLIIFDIFNKNRILKDIPNYEFIQRAMERDSKKIIAFNKTKYNKKSKILKSNLKIYLQEHFKKPSINKMSVKQRIYSTEEIINLIKKTGLLLQEISEPKGGKFNQGKSLFALFIIKSN